ncbi:MAG: phosphatase PAP2 family protein [Bacteroidota bacterium]
MEALLELDRNLLLFFNEFSSPLFDNFFWVITSVMIWVPMYAAILYVIVKEQGMKAIITILALVLMVTLCDQISANVFKDGFERLRPSREAANEGLLNIINGYRGGMHGFVSSHATNSFGLAVLSSLLFRYRWYTVFIMFWAVLNSYSRVYMGVHYPGDILGGLILGALIGWFVYWLYKKVAVHFMPLHDEMPPYGERRPFSPQSIRNVILTGLVTIIVILISSKILLELM